ncbi:DUF948 domain-containing protein [Paenibacillus piri]|uniref:DUF948 domain-containing protein n=1 Tax=Paenibacillus piri TaxID=2547395 RepID=A0A4R5KJU4_9BACL|nr:DUF948 domain-containing protein [Paenibacillus piri]TDF95793.1 DUF948 domain-containing protein [Paenibacillus piri]
MLWQIGVLAASIAVVVVACFMIPTVWEARKTMKETRSTLSQLQVKLEQTAEESNRLIRLTHQAVSDVHNNIKAADSFVEAVEQTGEAARRVSGTVKLVSQSLSDTLLEARSSMHHRQDTVRDLLELTSISMQLWQRWQTSKSSAKAADLRVNNHEGDEKDGSGEKR